VVVSEFVSNLSVGQPFEDLVVEDVVVEVVEFVLVAIVLSSLDLEIVLGGFRCSFSTSTSTARSNKIGARFQVPHIYFLE
jgi:hypothetical protein